MKKPGALIRKRNGRFVHLQVNMLPNSPLGASTNAYA